MSRTSNVPNADLQAKLRRMIERDGFESIARRLELSREPIAKYLAGLSMNSSTFRDIERSVQEAPEA